MVYLFLGHKNMLHRNCKIPSRVGPAGVWEVGSKGLTSSYSLRFYSQPLTICSWKAPEAGHALIYPVDPTQIWQLARNFSPFQAVVQIKIAEMATTLLKNKIKPSHKRTCKFKMQTRTVTQHVKIKKLFPKDISESAWPSGSLDHLTCSCQRWPVPCASAFPATLECHHPNASGASECLLFFFLLETREKYIFFY